MVNMAVGQYDKIYVKFMPVYRIQNLPGIIAGSILVFIPALGAYVTPDLLGGARSVMIANVIYSQFMSARDYPFGAAAAFGLMALMVVSTLFYIRQASSEKELEPDVG